MKKTYAFFLSTVLLLGGITTSCQNRTSYMGTLAGANLGSTIGSAVGWLGGGGNRGSGAAIGTIVGAVGGAVIGNAPLAFMAATATTIFATRQVQTAASTLATSLSRMQMAMVS